MRLLAWVVRAALFLLLFGLALNNQHEVVVRGLFGTEWRSPMIVVVLASFVAGVALTLFALGLRRLPIGARQTEAPGPQSPNLARGEAERASSARGAPVAPPSDRLTPDPIEGPARHGP